MRIAIDDGGARMSAPERFRLLYALAVLPMATDFIETGSWPGSPRAWITEIVLAVVISALVHRVCTVLHELARQARVDELTGLWNRRAFSEMLMDEVARAHRTGCALTLIYLDLDGFKRINDELGHDAGDAALRRAATVMLGAVRANVDRCFRIGGDEFALLLPASSAADASCVLQRIRARSAAMLPGDKAAPVAASSGVAELAVGEDARSLLLRADGEMYRHKVARTMSRGPGRPLCAAEVGVL